MRSLLAALMFSLSAVLALPALAQEEPKSLGTFSNWEAVTFKEGGKTGCYITSVPSKKEGAYTTRDKTYALVTHRPSDKTFNVITVVAGYTYKDNSTVTIKIGNTSFKLFTNKDAAWAPDADTDRKIVQAMIKGQGMVVTGTSARGTKTTDTYSLIGFTKAYRAIADACQAPAM
jgi:hypothetical protein